MTEIKGRTLILICVVLAATIGLSGAWFRVSMTDDCAKFWGPEGAHLITGKSHVELLELEPLEEETEPAEESGPTDEDGPDVKESGPQEKLAAGIGIVKRHDLTGRPGMVHFRNAMTLDQSYQWSGQEEVSLAATRNQWRWALVFSEGDQQLVVLLDESFERWGQLDQSQEEVSVVPAQYLDEMTAEYFEEIGVIGKPDGE